MRALRSLNWRLVFVRSACLSALAACHSTTSPAAPETAARALAVAGIEQAITVGTTGSDSLAVVVYGTSGDPLVGTSVAWAVSDGQGSLSAATSVTDARGIARVAFAAGTVSGLAHVTATAGNVAPVSFEEVLQPGAPARLVAMQATEDTVSAGSSFSGTLLRVVDQYGNAVPNVSLTVVEQASADGDGDYLATTALTTDANGTVTDTFVPSSSPGQRVLVFTTDSGLTLSYRIDVPPSEQFRASR